MSLALGFALRVALTVWLARVLPLGMRGVALTPVFAVSVLVTMAAAVGIAPRVLVAMTSVAVTIAVTMAIPVTMTAVCAAVSTPVTLSMTVPSIAVTVVLAMTLALIAAPFAARGLALDGPFGRLAGE